MRFYSHILPSIMLLFAALISSNSAHAAGLEWTGTFTTNYGDLRLIQSGDRVYGDYGTRGYIEGRINPAGTVMRGTFQYNSPRSSHGFIEFRRSGNRFEGGWSWTKAGPPARSKVNWTGSLRSSARPALKYARGKSSYWADMWATTSAANRAWATGSNASISRSGSTPPPPASQPGQAANDSDEFYPAQGNWSVTVQGAEYGPLAARRMVLQFTNPDSNGLVVGRAPGKPLVMIGQRAGNGGFRGVWMETAGPTNYQATGRWGVVRVSANRNANGSNIDALFSVGYRLPLRQVNNPGVPGMRARGTHLGGETGGNMPNARVLLSAWDGMVRKGSPFSAIHGIWPTDDINAAIQKWVGNERVAGNFGTTQNVDLCAAKCMGNEPQKLLIRMIGLRSDNERKVEIYGDLRANADLVKTSGGFYKTMGSTLIFQRARSNSIKRDGKFFLYVGPPTSTTPTHCYSNRSYGSLGQANFTLPVLAWSDPTLEIEIRPSGQLFEKDFAAKTDDRLPNFPYGSTKVKTSWQELATAPGDTVDVGAVTATTHPDTPCFAEWGKATDDNWPFRGTSADFKLMTTLR